MMLEEAKEDCARLPTNAVALGLSDRGGGNAAATFKQGGAENGSKATIAKLQLKIQKYEGAERARRTEDETRRLAEQALRNEKESLIKALEAEKQKTQAAQLEVQRMKQALQEKRAKLEKYGTDASEAAESNEKQKCEGDSAVLQTQAAGYRGVTYHKKDRRFYARIRKEGKREHLGSFMTAVDAATAYDEAARMYDGDEAVTNFLTEEEVTRQQQEAARQQQQSVVSSVMAAVSQVMSPTASLNEPRRQKLKSSAHQPVASGGNARDKNARNDARHGSGQKDASAKGSSQRNARNGHGAAGRGKQDITLQQEPAYVGDKLSVYWPDEDEWFVGRVRSQDAKGTTIVYEDGDEQMHEDMESEQYKLLPKAREGVVSKRPRRPQQPPSRYVAGSGAGLAGGRNAEGSNANGSRRDETRVHGSSGASKVLPKLGDKVLMYWPDEDEWFVGRVRSQDAKGTTIVYEDGDEQMHEDMESEQYTLLTRASPGGRSPPKGKGGVLGEGKGGVLGKGKPGKGRKRCPSCSVVMGVRSASCDECTHVFSTRASSATARMAAKSQLRSTLQQTPTSESHRRKRPLDRGPSPDATAESSAEIMRPKGRQVIVRTTPTKRARAHPTSNPHTSTPTHC
jgi:hypothetical protein